MTAIPEPVVTVARYEVSCLPEAHIDRAIFTVDVERRGHGKWAVARFKRCYDIDGEPDWEPLPSAREDEWLARYRHDLDTALEIARKVAPLVRVNGLGVADVIYKEEDL